MASSKTMDELLDKSSMHPQNVPEKQSHFHIKIVFYI
jgi:hypothetical protein